MRFSCYGSASWQGNATGDRLSGVAVTMKRICLLTLVTLASSVLPCVATHAGTPTYSIGYYTISAGGNTLRGRCFVLSGTAAQTAPGYSSGGIYSMFAGFWTPAFAPPPSLPTDEIFFNGFEGCSS